MPDPTQFARHATLVDHMARALGVDLDEQILRGNLSLSQVEDAVLSCTNCTQPCACESWLASQHETAPEAPGYCRNVALFDALRDI
ncbi:hypothetical protein AL036_15405 [Salipiger aestuarii]|uniref:DUF6455 domain-containing protein n=1 Tax=Salipiger aestuarii TaxID=568098 RepID=A0A327Y217_9RHOB|nr:DUF6455 family protein [Salipiger aestuarii]EIE52825.1 hypothetical protein C357_01790 [Citreicella sp. 357]KAA8606235.1 hypothetical protein AL036_15405 [Salipiger aestuarii]KAA8609180.1 hypothetical protein AL037_15745 [Salipiger aestuarii]KAB2540865.1 hypothetical protein AL035_15235 [Salipiger aestuarii]RAK12429.1 hypothetical protein ATI53_104238 [Salipiger aestuarii]